MVWTWWVGIASLLGAFAVGLGAFGAHAMKARLSADMLRVYETAVQYHFWHVLALLAVGLVSARIDSLWTRAAGSCFLVGTLLFSGSLYALAISGNRSLGMITPFGGLLLICGWLSLAITFLRPY